MFYSIVIIQLLITASLFSEFIHTQDHLKPYLSNPKVVVIASPGRSGSSLLTAAIRQSYPFLVLKTHILPPPKSFKGKVVFIFSNPDQAAESALRRTMERQGFGRAHFEHMESADIDWFKSIGDTPLQTLEHNLLSYDALGCYLQLEQWLHTKTQECPPDRAQILAVKYEHLWEKATKNAIKSFLHLEKLPLPPYKQRGVPPEELTPEVALFRQTYNLGTDDVPIYAAYDRARLLWQAAPPYQFLEIK